MRKIGRYGIAFGGYPWFQTRMPTLVRHFLWFWFFKEVSHIDVNKIDEKRQFPLGTWLEQEGRKYYYYKAGEDIVVKGEE